MAQFLRDVHLSNLKVTEELLIQLTEVFTNRAQILHNSATAQGNEYKEPFLTFILRFDNKGYRLFTCDDLLLHFKRADKVERVVISIETRESLTSNRHIGEHLEVKFDTLEEKNCSLSVTSDHSDWVDASYSAVMEVITKHKTKTGWIRSGWSTLVIQLLGVVGGFALSLWAAEAIA
ncbi:MAG: hypothetical protein OXN26_04085, partial [Gammaproteobacteria bacterium]|nr:hypothetical protein [Gammaproteobacteria bacterium]